MITETNDVVVMVTQLKVKRMTKKKIKAILDEQKKKEKRNKYPLWPLTPTVPRLLNTYPNKALRHQTGFLLIPVMRTPARQSPHLNTV